MDTINQAIVVAHGSATAPHYGFLQKTYDKRPYKPLIEELALRFTITDTTDLNYDSAMVYSLRQQEEHCLLLSLVGKFFLLFDSIVDRQSLVEQPATEEARAVFRAAQQYGFVPIDRATLKRRTCLVDDEGGTKTVWEALFDRS
ncbi:hypothetical protein [Hymenobacter terrestris]|uniref:Uncharacterized protein n=1 Tax=Hymenobacter terrestris TaxID=2748310 RepID=A0ABX2Q585_9BACT|nr:hypothetical protein [Hymenobacter terrestris]NVO85412.1 hypothetical protein [Hymenobacter terrestris]